MTAAYRCVYFLFSSLIFTPLLFATPIPAPWEEVPQFHDKSPYDFLLPQQEAAPPFPAPHPRAREIQFRPLHYDLNLRIDPARGDIAGSLRFTFLPLVQNLGEITLDAAQLTVHRVHAASAHSPLLFSNNHRIITISLPPNLPMESPYSVVIHYEGLPRENLYFAGPDITNPTRMAAAYTYSEPEGSKFWFPCLDLPSAKARFDLRVRVKKPYKVLSNGELISQRETASGLNYFHYRMKQAIAPYLVSVAIGNYEVISLGSFKGKPLSLWTPPQLRDAALVETAGTKTMMEYFSSLTGLDYPFSTYSQSVAQAWTTSMEHQTATTMGGYRIAGDGTGEDVVAHELAHQWFGDWVTCAEWGELWLNEGFASYFPMRYLAAVGKHDSSLSYEDAWRQNYFAEAKNRVHPLSAAHPTMADIFDNHAYAKGALLLKFFHALTAAEGGFTRILHTYLSRHGGGNVRSSDLQRAAEQVTGHSWEQFFNQWVRSAGHPILHARWQQQAGVFSLSLTQQQALDQNKAWIDFSFPLQVEIIGRKGERLELSVPIDDTYQVREVNIPFEIAGVNLDPEWIVPLEWQMEEKTRRQENFLAVLRWSPREKSRIYAMRQIFADAKEAGFSAELADLLSKDASLYLQADALSHLTTSPSYAPLVARLLGVMAERSPKAAPRLPVIAAMAAAKTWLINNSNEQPSSEALQEWQNAYLQSAFTSERKALLERLSHASLPQGQSFALDRLKEGRWGTRDRHALIDALTVKPSATSREFIVASLRASAPHWFVRIAQNLYTAEYQHPELAPILIEQLEFNRYSLVRNAAVNLLSIQKKDRSLICPELGRIREKLRLSLPLTAELIVALDGTSSSLQCK